MLSLNRIDNSIQYYGEKIGVLDNGYLPYDAFQDIEKSYEESLTIEDRLMEAEEKGQSEGQKTGRNNAIDKIEYDLECLLDSILDHSEHELTEEFKAELTIAIDAVIQDAKNAI